MKAPIPLRRNPFPDWKWPLTRKERIAELEPLLRNEHWEQNFANIKAAIEWHGRFDGDTFCDATLISFQHGRKLESLEELTSGAQWVEVGDPEKYSHDQ
jgi:hypothetical protein